MNAEYDKTIKVFLPICTYNVFVLQRQYRCARLFVLKQLRQHCVLFLFRSVEAYNKEQAEGFSANALFKAFGNFVGIFGGAFLIGSVFGMVTALLTKYTKIRDFPLLETAMFFLMSYASFQTSEAAGLTGKKSLAVNKASFLNFKHLPCA